MKTCRRPVLNQRVKYLYATDDEFECHIAAKKNWLLLTLIPLLLLARTKDTYIAMAYIFHAHSIYEFLFRSFWLLLFLTLFALMTVVWTWNAFGKEVILITEGNLSIKRDVFGYGRTRRFLLQKISNIEVSIFHNIIFWFANFIWWDMNSGVIAFSYENQTHRFGLKLEEMESHKLLKKLQRYVIKH